MITNNNPQPLVSIISFTKDRVKTIRRSVDSVLDQSHRHLEFVVQDGASTDGTLEILMGYDDTRIKLVSEPDSGPAEAFWKVLNRCEGDIIGTCLSDEELVPGALEKAVEFFRNNPDVGAMTCDGYITNGEGVVTGSFIAGEFNMVDYLFSQYCPFWPGSFFRRKALLDIGLRPELKHEWTIGCLEFEIWCRLGTRHNIKYVPFPISKYTVTDDQLSNTPKNFNEHLDNRATIVEKIFSESGFLSDVGTNKIACLYNQYYLFYNHTRAYKMYEQTEEIHRQIRKLLDDSSIEFMAKLGEEYSIESFTTTDVDELQAKKKRIQFLWMMLVSRIPRFIYDLFPKKVRGLIRLKVQRFMLNTYIILAPKAIVKRDKKILKKTSLETILGLEALVFSKTIYADTAQIYYGRGQIEQALQLWSCAEDLKDVFTDGIACQAMLLSTKATNQRLFNAHRKWADRHAQPDPILLMHQFQRFKGDRKIRIGYHCAFMESDTIRYIMSSVIKCRDLNRFEAYGYSVTAVSNDIAEAFDVVRNSSALSDEEFVKLIRKDCIDIFVELTGFSPFHRFTAMASRCAPIQISYLNHTATSAVPNVDYIFADAISVLPEEEQFFTEKVWRLPGCFLSYTYDPKRLPQIAPVPSKSRGYVTFGYFGSGGKLGDELIAIWARVMNCVPNSRIYLRNYQLNSESNREFMVERFSRHGIAAERIRIESGAEREEILRSYSEVDISLDTWPYCGGNTVAESLWQGVPVLTLKGDRFSGRYGASLMVAAGCPELVAENVDQLIEIAAKLSTSMSMLEYYRTNLRRLATENGLSDAKRFANKLDAAYIEMVKRRFS
jgi:glycosyltransferase involved in cell wall biosynthesis